MKLWDTMDELAIPKKEVQHRKMYVRESRFRIRLEGAISVPFEASIGLM